MLDGNPGILGRLGAGVAGAAEEQCESGSEAGDEFHHGSPKSVVGMPDKFRLLTRHSITGFQIG
ncbi:MAG TPA: hypothetical protein DC058_16705 [Planctomycetaceae bacterium]|nr:hypothetical protein [Planctomycetaceae bacterium]HBC62839.1 hypothetical protein [Planctomycetaceae bacterium]